MLLSGPVWINVVAQWGGIWALFTLLTQAPTYFNNVHHWDAGMVREPPLLLAKRSVAPCGWASPQHALCYRPRLALLAP